MLSRIVLLSNNQALSRVNAVTQKFTCRSIHVTCHARNIGKRANSVLTASKYAPILGCAKRYSSTNEAVTGSLDKTLSGATESTAVPLAIDGVSGGAGSNIAEGLSSKLLENIPDAPVAPTLVETVSYVGEPALSTLGLAGWTPVGIIQQALEVLHVSCGLPWWEAIAIGTIALRFALFPLVVKTQKNNAAMANNMPELTRIQAELTEARQDGDQLRVGRLTTEMITFMKGKNCNPLKNMILPLLQAPIFLSTFLGLRKMAELPVESMKEGGLWWFTDLTCADPYYILPLITAGTLAITIELGTDSSRAEMLGLVKYALRALPIIILPFTINFPAAILCYWVSNNFISLLQVGFLKIPRVRQYFNIPTINVPKKSVTATKKGFIREVKASFANMKSARELSARYVADDVQFHRAGRGPVQQTFSYDPTRELRKKEGMIMAKKR